MNYWISKWSLIPLIYTTLIIYFFQMENKWPVIKTFYYKKSSNNYTYRSILKKNTQDKLSKMMINNNK
jgi:hypothetical protein